MKTLNVAGFLGIFLSISIFSFSQSQPKSEKIKVWGNCGMCKKTIEQAALKAGAATADWNVESKVLAVSFTGKGSDSKKVQQAVAAAGYDTQDFTAPTAAYEALHECCQYDRKGDLKKVALPTTEKTDCCAAGKDCCKNGTCSKANDCCKNASCCDGKACSKSGVDGTAHANCCKDGTCMKNTDCCKGKDTAACKEKGCCKA